MGGIVWLASYPKSGSTWFRIFLSNLLQSRDRPVDINALAVNRLACERTYFDEVTGVESSDLTQAELDQLRPEVYRYLAEQAEETLYVKNHDAYTYLPGGCPVFPVENAKAVYLVRNPLDVAVSYSFHIEENVDSIITKLNKPDCSIGKIGRCMTTALPQLLTTWSQHVESWLDAPLAVHVMRYEDMKRDPLAAFSRAADFMGITDDECLIRRAIEFSDFRILQDQEKRTGFTGIQMGRNLFFREGKSGGWRQYLTPEQVARVVHDHGRVMRRLGYLDEKDELLV